MASPVFFIRGLSTNGSDEAQWSIFNVGPMARQFTKAFAERNVPFIPVEGLGGGTILELSKRVREILERHPAWSDPETSVHIFGHSAGGLVARLLAAQPDIPAGKIKSVITVATPNSGSRFAAHCMSIPEQFPGSARFLRACGYDINIKSKFMQDLAPENVAATLNLHGKIPPHTKQASIVCWAPRKEWCWPLKLFYTLPCFDAFDFPSDGMVERDVQAFGEVIAELQIDHFRQIGIFGKPEKFAELCDTLAGFFNREST